MTHCVNYLTSIWSSCRVSAKIIYSTMSISPAIPLSASVSLATGIEHSSVPERLLQVRLEVISPPPCDCNLCICSSKARVRAAKSFDTSGFLRDILRGADFAIRLRRRASDNVYCIQLLRSILCSHESRRRQPADTSSTLASLLRHVYCVLTLRRRRKQFMGFEFYHTVQSI